MKKLMLVFSILMLSILILNISVKAETNGKLLTDFNSNQLIHYYNSETPIYVPSEAYYKKQEFRAVWVTTIYNLDIPIHLSQDQYKGVLTEMLDTLEEYNINAIFYQVRPKNDAMYPSTLNPWSRYMTGTEGVDPGWDPLEWLVEETHKRGIEFHAWFNPYRVFVNGLSENNFANKHPEYVMKPGVEANDEILNPGIPDVQQFIVNTVMEVVNNYDVDGVHFDDYFYPYGKFNDALDENEFKAYNPNNLSLNDWRRENVNNVIKGIKAKLTEVNTEENRAVQLGVSPFGVWANKSNHPDGSNTTSGVESYSLLYADSRRWVKEGWVDYIVPQLYFHFGNTNAAYADLVDWWADVVNGTNVNLYTGQSIYRYNEKGWNSPAWPDPDELINQQLYNSKFEEVQGSVQFRYNYLKLNYSENLVYAQNTLKNNLFKFKVLTPAVKNIDAIILPAPQNLAIEKLNQVNQLTWNKDVNAKAYYVYRYNENELATLHEIKNVIDIIYPTENDVMTYLDETAEDGTSYRYFVTPFNKTNNEGISAGINTSGVSITTVDKSIIGVMSNIRKTREQVNIFNLLTDYIMNTTSSVFDLTTSLNNIYNDIEDLDEEIIAFDTSELTLKRNNFNDSITELNNLLLSDTTTAEELEVAYSDINTKKAEIETLLNDYQTKFDEFKATRDEINNDIKTFTNTYSINLSNTLEKLDTTQIRTYLDHFITMVAVINEDKENLDSQFQTTIEEINQLNNSVTASETRITKVDRNIQSARLNVDDLIDLADELDEHKAAFGTSFSRFNSTFKAIKIVETKNDLNTQITQLRTSIDEFKANQDKDEDINSETPIIEPVDDPKENKINYPLIIVSFSAVVILSAGIVLIIKNRH